jgi:thiamine-phosphate diphosphorylase
LALSYYITARRELAVGAGRPEAALKEIVRQAFGAGVNYVQVREKDLPGGRLARLVEELLALPEKAGSRLLVNERLDVARASGADGVHLPADSLPVGAVRQWVGSSWIVGVSCHSAQEVEQAAAGGADYVLLGRSLRRRPSSAPSRWASRVWRRFAGASRFRYSRSAAWT